MESNVLRTNDARDFPADNNLLAGDHTGYLALLADDDFHRLDVALDLAVDLQGPAADDLEPLPHDLEVVADDGFFAA